MVFKSNVKVPIIFLLAILIVIPFSLAFAKESCVPQSCPISTYNGRQTSTAWTNSTFNTSVDSVCVKDGGITGDFCVRTCNMANGCYGTATTYSSNTNTLLNQQCAYGTTGFVNSGQINLDSNYCYSVLSYTTYKPNNPSLFFNWAHYYNGSYSSPFFLFLDGTNHGATTVYNNEYIFLYPFGYGLTAPTGYDLTYTRYNTSITEARLTPTSGCSAGVTYDLWAEHYIYKIPFVSSYSTQTSCVQNAQILAPNVNFQLNSPGQNKYWDWLSGRQTITRPSDNLFFVTIQWGDDAQDNGNYSSLTYIPKLTLMSANPGSIPLKTSFTNLSYSCGGGPPAVCAVSAQFYVNISQLPDGDVDFFIFLDDGFYDIRNITKFGTFYRANLVTNPTPTVILNSPVNGASFSPGTFITFNYTSISQTGSVTNTLSINNNPYFSGSEANGTHIHSFQFNNTGTYNWKVQGTDSYGTTITAQRTFTIIDASNPSITSTNVNNVNVGQNAVCNANVVAGTYPISKVWCTLSPQSATINMPNIGGTSYSGSLLTTAGWATTQTWIIYANDTQGNKVNATGVVLINHAPTFSSQNVNPTSPTTYGPTKQTTFTSIWNDDIGTSSATITFTSGPLSGQSFTGTKSGNTYIRVFTGMNAGTYQYYWTVTDNGGLTATSPSQSYIINKATPTVQNLMSPSFTVPTGTAVTGSCVVLNSTGGNMYYNKCGLQTPQSTTTPSTLSITPITPSTGIYTCNCTSLETANWNKVNNIQTLTVSTATGPTVTNLQPINASVVNAGTTVFFNATVTAGSYPINTVTLLLNNGVILSGPMTSIGGGVYQRSVTMQTVWPTPLEYKVIAVDTNTNVGQNSVNIFNNHAPTPYNSQVSPPQGQPYSPSTTYTFNISWIDDIDAIITSANITIDGTTYSATHLGGGNFTYSIIGLSTGLHNYTWTATDSNGLIGTTGIQTYSVGITATILQIFITPSVSVIEGTQTTANCTSNVPVNLTLYRNGILVSNPDVQTLGVGTYTYICNTTGGGNYSAGSTSDILIVNSQNSQTQTQFCDGQFSKQYTYYNGSENYTMCVNLPCGANVTSATVDLTGLPLFKLVSKIIGFFRLDGNQISSCLTTGASFSYNYRIYCNNSNIYMNNGRVEMIGVRLVNSTFNNTVYNLPLTFSNVLIKDAYILNGEVISGTIEPLTSYDEYGESIGLYNITFDT